MNKKLLTAHCIIKNEENVIYYSIMSIIDHVDYIFIFDTGSQDKTISIVEKLVKRYPEKIIFEKKGVSDKNRHTQLRQEMIDRTETEWFMIIDGDEVWTKRGVDEVIEKINTDTDTQCFIAPFYLCVGDIFHHSWRGLFTIRGKKIHATARIFRNQAGIHWSGEYGRDVIVEKNGAIIAENTKTEFLKNRFWHLTHLKRSNITSDYSSGGYRSGKEVPTYFIIGKKILESAPEVFSGKITNRLHRVKSLYMFIPYTVSRAWLKLKSHFL